MGAPSEIVELVERFERNREAYLAGRYNEAQLRREFIDPMFAALGWDVINERGYAEAYKDVIHEDSIKIGSATKAPDYCFRIGGTRKFFLEAKKPSVDIKGDPGPAYQLRRYAWSAKLPLSVLTDFEEFAVYDCRVRPVSTDKSSTARTVYLTYRDYAERWDEIASIFSRDAVLKGSFDKYADTSRQKKGTAEVDASFLAEIETWREALAKNIALRNPALNFRELNFAVQLTIDRIIFLRICEDRGIEHYGRLMALLNGSDVYARLLVLFRQADDRYNSGLFHFSKEKGRHDEPDELTPGLTIDDKTLKEIFRRLYYPDSPFEFSVLPAEILGHVYEQFLGSTITLTAGHRAVVENKPEVKKAGGVFYTPSYIVDYIVQNTVGKLVEEKTPKEVSTIKVLDPACGSGSFLLGAYQFLLDWHLRYYLDHEPEAWVKKKNPPVCESVTQHGYMLTLGERKRILLNSIYGVDIDGQAVEVTKLSLLLKVLEGQRELKLFATERALPDLCDNIKCGNSLIGTDFYTHQQMTLFDDEMHYKINAFDWEKEFKDIFARKNGGFDAVIGNPPYIRIQTMKDTQPESVTYFGRQYKSAAKGNYDIYVVFVEKALSLLNTNGRMGYILPHKFFNAQYGQPLRQIIANGKHLSEVVHFGAQQIFSGATTYTCLLILTKSKNVKFVFRSIADIADWISAGNATSGNISTEQIKAAAWSFSVGYGSELIEKLKLMPVKLGDLSDIFVGLQTSADDVFIMDCVGQDAKTFHLHSKAQDAVFKLEKPLFYPLVSGTDVQGYEPLPERQYILFPYDKSGETVKLYPFETIEKAYPDITAYLLLNKKRLEGREKGKFKGEDWYKFGRNQNIGIQNRIKLCVPRLVDKLCAGYDENGTHFLDNVDVGGVSLKPAYQNYDLRYFMCLLNSRLLGWFFPNISAPFRGGWMSANRQFLSQLPIRTIDFKNHTEKDFHDKLVGLVELMLDLHKKLSGAKTPDEKVRLGRQIAATDEEIDGLVYALYGLTEDEIRIVEGAAE
jgi:hypothetical protein